jgi:hypothetical protein
MAYAAFLSQEHQHTSTITSLVVSGRTASTTSPGSSVCPRPAKLRRHFNHRPVLVPLAETITLISSTGEIWSGGNSSFAIVKLSQLEFGALPSQGCSTARKLVAD